MRPRKYRVLLTQEEHDQLVAIVALADAGSRRARYAQILLKLDENHNDPVWTIAEIAEAFDSNTSMICRVARRYADEGLECALNRKEQDNRFRKLTPEIDAHIAAMVAADPPAGQKHWTATLVAKTLVADGTVDSISQASVSAAFRRLGLPVKPGRPTDAGKPAKSGRPSRRRKG